MLEEFTDTQVRDPVANVTVPLMREQDAIGAMSVARDAPQAFSPREIALVESFADQAVIAIENARLFEELEQRNARASGDNRQSEALEQQTATGEILRVIASSPTELAVCLHTISRAAARLCEADFTIVYRLIEDRQTVALPRPRGRSDRHCSRERAAVPLNRASVAGRTAVLTA